MSKSKKLHVLILQHMDLVWRRCFARDSLDGEQVFCSYTTLEEAQISQMLSLAERDGVCVAIEQVLSVEAYLRENPDELDRLRRLVRAGKLEILGAGMAALDTNLLTGETLLRNQTDGARYRARVLGQAPQRWANCCDLFGLSGQMPQIYRLVGYRGICQFSRVFPENKPAWRGIYDNSLIALANNERTTTRIHFGRYVPICPVCRGAGCVACRMTGTDLSYIGDSKVNLAEARRALEVHREDDGDTWAMFWSEEGMLDETFADDLRALARELGYGAVDFVTPGDYNAEAFDPIADRIERGEMSEEDVQPEREANVVATGCYTSRIVLKQRLREAEAALWGAEKLAAFAAPYLPYPAGKLENLRKKLYLLGFHDAVTGSHSDAAYEELLGVCRELRRGAWQIAQAAGASLCAGMKPLPVAGGRSFVLMNPADTDAHGVPLSLSLHTVARTELRVLDAQGTPLTVVETRWCAMPSGWRADVTFLGDVPAHGWNTFVLVPDETDALPTDAPNAPATPVDSDAATESLDSDAAPTVDSDTVEVPEVNKATGPVAPTPEENEASDAPEAFIENEFYRIDRRGILDRKTGKILCGTGEFRISDDIGDPWGRHEPEKNHHALPFAYTRAEHDGARHVLHLSGGDASPAPQGTEGAEWMQYTLHVTLIDGCDTVYYRADVDWRVHDRRLYAAIPLSFACREATYQIPFGTIRRGLCSGEKGPLGYCDEWPALDWFAAQEATSGDAVVLMQRGLHGCRVIGDAMEISLMRVAPLRSDLLHDGCMEASAHCFEFALTVSHGGATACDPTGCATLYQTTFTAQEIFAPADDTSANDAPANDAPANDAPTSNAPAKDACADAPTSAECSAPCGMAQNGAPGVAQKAPRGQFFPAAEGGVHIPALFRREDGALVARFFDAYGQGGVLSLPAGVVACPADAFGGNAHAMGAPAVKLRPYEIATAVIRTASGADSAKKPKN